MPYNPFAGNGVMALSNWKIEYLKGLGLTDEYIANIDDASVKILEQADLPVRYKTVINECKHCGVTTDKKYGTCEHCGAPLPTSQL